MQAGLLTSQFQTLEIPRSDETDVITLAITQPVDDLVRQVLAALQTHRDQTPPRLHAAI
jgi:gluconate kinase